MINSEMTNLDQRVLDVYTKHTAIIEYLNEIINISKKKKDTIAYYSVCITENLNDIKNFITELYEVIQNKEGNIHVLQNAVKGLQDTFDDLDMEND